MDEVSFVETSSVLDETDISMNVSIGGADGGPDEDTLTPDSPVAWACFRNDRAEKASL